MSDAPERIWLDGDATIDEGVFPRCFATPKPASDPPMEFVRADLHAAAVARAEAAEEACAEQERYLREADAMRAALAVAEEALRKIDVGEGWAAQIARAAIVKIAALKGGDA